MVTGGIDGTDIRRMISEMRKDKVLEKYQYFVGSLRDRFRKDASKNNKNNKPLA